MKCALISCALADHSRMPKTDCKILVFPVRCHRYRSNNRIELRENPSSGKTCTRKKIESYMILSLLVLGATGELPAMQESVRRLSYPSIFRTGRSLSDAETSSRCSARLMIIRRSSFFSYSKRAVSQQGVNCRRLGNSWALDYRWRSLNIRITF